MHRIQLSVLMVLSLLVAGCQSTQRVSQPGALSPIESCRQLLSLVDQAVVDAETTDTSVFRVKGFPYLRTNRFLGQMAATENSPPAIRRWLEGMHQLDLEAREKERPGCWRISPSLDRRSPGRTGLQAG